MYGSQPPAVDWSKRLPRAVYIKAYLAPTGPQREEFTTIHLDDLHSLFDDLTFCPNGHHINNAIKNFMELVEDPASIKDATYMILVGDAKKTASQVRWMRDVRERLRQPDEYYKKIRARDDRHRCTGRREKSSLVTRTAAQPTQLTFLQKWCNYGQSTDSNPPFGAYLKYNTPHLSAPAFLAGASMRPLLNESYMRDLKDRLGNIGNNTLLNSITF